MKASSLGRRNERQTETRSRPGVWEQSRQEEAFQALSSSSSSSLILIASYANGQARRPPQLARSHSHRLKLRPLSHLGFRLCLQHHPLSTSQVKSYFATARYSVSSLSTTTLQVSCPCPASSSSSSDLSAMAAARRCASDGLVDGGRAQKCGVSKKTGANPPCLGFCCAQTQSSNSAQDLQRPCNPLPLKLTSRRPLGIVV